MDRLHSLISHPTQRLWANNLPKKSDLVYPIFVVDGEKQKQEIKSMPNVYRYSIDMLEQFLQPLVDKELKSILIFGVVDGKQKDELGTLAGGLGQESCVHRALQYLRHRFPQLLLIVDVCLCGYTTHGHCGVLDSNGDLDNNKSIIRLAECALSYAKSGAHIVAPSDMMDQRVKSIREHLDKNSYEGVPIMSYSAKFCSALYGPFRDVCGSAPQKFDRSTYQLPPGSRELALLAADRDVNEGASYLMVKPISAYLDIASLIKAKYPNILLACYQVSGEYSMLCLAADNGLFDKKRIVLEYMESFRRAGCDIIITYFVPELLDWIK